MLSYVQYRFIFWKIFFTILFLLGLSLISKAQIIYNLEDFNTDRLMLTQKGMYVLGGWALTNIAAGSVLYYTDPQNKNMPERKYFHQMNIFWNFVNLGLAAGSLLTLEGTSGMSLTETIDAQNQLEKLLLFNAGLDVAYICGGFLMIEKAKSVTKNRALLKGYGKSLILQGAFLLIFDAGFYLVQNKNAQNLKPLIEINEIGQSSFGFRYNF